MVVAEYDMYSISTGEIDNRIVADTKFPIVSDTTIKICCKATLEITKAISNYMKNSQHAAKEREPKAKAKMTRKSIKDEKVCLDKAPKLSRKFITFDRPLCQGNLHLRNEIEINPKGIKCSCNPCSFEISKSMNVPRAENGDIKLDSEDNSISFSRNRQITPEDTRQEQRNQNDK